MGEQYAVMKMITCRLYAKTTPGNPPTAASRSHLDKRQDRTWLIRPQIIEEPVAMPAADTIPRDVKAPLQAAVQFRAKQDLHRAMFYLWKARLIFQRRLDPETGDIKPYSGAAGAADPASSGAGGSGTTTRAPAGSSAEAAARDHRELLGLKEPPPRPKKPGPDDEVPLHKDAEIPFYHPQYIESFCIEGALKEICAHEIPPLLNSSKSSPPVTELELFIFLNMVSLASVLHLPALALPIAWSLVVTFVQQRAGSNDPTVAQGVLHHLALGFFRGRDYKFAARAFLMVVKNMEKRDGCSPELGAAYNNVGSCYMMLGRSREAVAYYTLGGKMLGLFAPQHPRLGVMQRNLDQARGACFGRALEERPHLWYLSGDGGPKVGKKKKKKGGGKKKK